MIAEIDKILRKLNWDNSDKIQEEGIRQAKEIKSLSVFFQPIEDKMAWENCAKVIIEKTNEELYIYIYNLLEWIQDMNWPGSILIYKRIKEFPIEMIEKDILDCISKAKAEEDEQWLSNLESLINKSNLFS